MNSPALLAARVLATASQDTLENVCSDHGQQPGIACRLTWNLTHNRTAAELVKVWLAQPVSVVLRIIFVLLVAVLIRIAAHRLINRITARASQAGAQSHEERRAGDVPHGDVADGNVFEQPSINRL